MENILIVVDVQPEFYSKGIYEKILDYISNSRVKYDIIVATQFRNYNDSNFCSMLDWNECYETKDLDFVPDVLFVKYGYGFTTVNNKEKETILQDANKNKHFDVIGCNTDACVMAICFELFDRGLNFSILADYCYSTLGDEINQMALCCMKESFGKALKRIH